MPSGKKKNNKDKDEVNKTASVITDPYYAHKAQAQGKTVTADPYYAHKEQAKETAQVQSAQTNTADRKAKTAAVIDAVTQGAKSGDSKAKLSGETKKADKTQTKRSTAFEGSSGKRSYQYYQNAIADAKTAEDKEKTKVLKNEYTQFKTDRYYSKQNALKNALAKQAGADPEKSAFVDKGQRIYDAMTADKNKPRFGININTSGNNSMDDAFNTRFKLGNFTEDEKNTYLYLLGKNGWASADAYEKLLERDTNARKAEKETEFFRNYAHENKIAGVGLNATASLLGTSGLADTVIRGVQNARRPDEEFEPADKNRAAFLPTRIQEAATEGITQDIQSEKGKFAAEIALSTINFLASAALGGGAASLAVMGGNAGAGGAYEAIERGASPEQAAWIGCINAAAEIALEKVPLESFGKLASGEGKETLIKAIRKMAVEEGLEEVGTEYLNLLGDRVVMGDKSEMNQFIRDMKAEGATDEEAKKAAVWEFVIKGPALAFAGGAISGAGIGAAGAGIGRLMNTNAMIDTIAEAVAEENGISKEEALNVVQEAIERAGTEETAEVQPEARTLTDIDEETRAQLIEAVKEDTGMSDEEARAAVEEAIAQTGDNIAERGENLTETGEPEPERIWERAAREQAKYDAEWERTHPQEVVQAEPSTQEILQNAEEYEQARQAKIREDAVARLAVNKFREQFGAYRGTELDAGVESWINQEIEKNGIPEAFAQKPEDYADYLAWNLAEKAKQNYPQAQGMTVAGKMENALRAALTELSGKTYTENEAGRPAQTEPRINRKQVLSENPEGAEAFIKENYSKGANGLWGSEVYNDKAALDEDTAIGQRAEGAKRNFQEKEDAIRKREKRTGRSTFTEDEWNTLNELSKDILKVSGTADENIRAQVTENVISQILRGDAATFPTGDSVTVPRWVNNNLIAELLPFLVEYDAATSQYAERSGALKAAAGILADRAAPAFDNARDLKTPLSYYLLSPQRVFDSIFRDMPATAKWFNENFADPIGKNTANADRMRNTVFRRVGDLGIETNKKHLYHLEFANKDNVAVIGDFNESGVLQIYGEGLINDAKLESLTDKQGNAIDADKIRHAKDVISAEYKRLLDSINAVLVEYGYTPSMEVKDYFPHFNEEDTNMWQKLMRAAGYEPNVTQLPTNLQGKTEKNKPGKQYFGNILRRTGDTTTYDAIGGFQKYVNVASDIIYHTGDIQRFRALQRAVEDRYGESQLNSELRDVQDSRIRGKMNVPEYYEAKNQIEEERAKSLSKMSNFVQWTQEEANLLAGKQSFLDRAMERLFGRMSLRHAEEVMRNFANNTVGFNVNTAPTNLIPLFQDDTNPKYKLKAIKEIVENGLNVDEMIDKSDFLTRRYGTKPLVMTKMQNIRQKGFFLMELVDRFTARSLVRARYYQNLDAGMSEDQALAEADDHVARVMVDRSKGMIPTLFQAKNPLIRALTMFQVEQMNQFQYAFMDIPRQNRDKAVGAVAAAIFSMFFGSFIYNELLENVTHRRAAADPIDIAWQAINDYKGRKRSNLLQVALAGEDLYTPEDITPEEARDNLIKNIAQEVPVLGSILGGGRVPISEAMPDKNVIKDYSGDMWDSPKAFSKVMKEWAKPVTYLASPVGGGVQAKKTIEGLSEMAEGGSYIYDKEGNKNLRYPVDNSNPMDWVKNAVWGRTASEGYQQWKKSGYPNLSKDQTAAYKKIVQNGSMSYDQFMSAIYSMGQYTKKNEKARALYDLDGLSAAQKQELWEALTNYSTKAEYVPDFRQNKKDFYKTWEVTSE